MRPPGKSTRIALRMWTMTEYVLRAGKKNGTVEDLEKALWYLQLEIKTRKESK